MSEITINDIRIIVEDALKANNTIIIEACMQKDELVKARCKAHEIFNDKENVSDFYDTKNKVDHHIETHKENESKNFRKQGLLLAGLTIAVNSIWNFVNWKS